MDKAETKKDIQRFGPGNVLERLDCMGEHASKEVVGLDKSRLMTNNYLKEGLRKEAARQPDVQEITAEEDTMRDDPTLNVSKARVVTRW